jgi:hypothetical protein
VLRITGDDERTLSMTTLNLSGQRVLVTDGARGLVLNPVVMAHA